MDMTDLVGAVLYGPQPANLTYSPQRYTVTSLWRKATSQQHDPIYLAVRRDGSMCLMKVDTFDRNKTPIGESLEFATIKYLDQVGGGHDNVLKVYQFFEMEYISRQVLAFAGVLVTERANTDLLRYSRMRGRQMPYPVIRKYMSDILQALAYCHEHGVIHGNVTPLTVFVRKSGLSGEKEADEDDEFKLAGFDRCHWVSDMRRNVKGDTQIQFRAPEMMLRTHDSADPMLFGTAIDIWSLGCTLAALMRIEEVFFDSDKDTPPSDQLNLYLQLLGSPTREALRSGTLPSDLQIFIASYYPAYLNVFDALFSPNKYPANVVDLLKRMLVLEPRDRVTAQEALTHPFFAEIY